MSNTKEHQNVKKYLVYLHTLSNENNKMYYVGVTFRKPEERWGRDGSGYKSNKHFYNAIQKYGWDNFEHEILASNLSLEEANNLEQYYVSLYNSSNPIHGYNKTKGGIGIIKGNKTKNRKNQKNVYQFSLNYKFINYYDSIAMAERATNTTQIGSGARNHKSRNGFLWAFEEDVYFDGQTYCLNYKYENMKGVAILSIYQFDRNGHFIKKYNGYKQASKESNVDEATIRKSIENEFKSYYKHDYLWRKEEDVCILNGIVQDIELRKNEKQPKDTIFQFDLNGTFLKSYLSVPEICRKYDYNQTNIRYAIHNDFATAYGFLWRDLNGIVFNEAGSIIIKNIYKKDEVKIYKFNLYGNYVKTYNSKKEVCDKYNMSIESLDNNLYKRTYSAFGYIWRLEEDIVINNGQIFLKNKFSEKEKEIYEKLQHKHSKIYQFSLNGIHINTFLNVEDASNVVKISRRRITEAAGFYTTSSGGFLWRYEDGVVIDNNGDIQIKELRPKKKQRKHICKTN